MEKVVLEGQHVRLEPLSSAHLSGLTTAINDGKQVSQVVHFKAHDLLKATNRITSGEGYSSLKAALERLKGTQISTNIVTGGHETFDTFGLIDRARVVREHAMAGRTPMS